MKKFISMVLAFLMVFTLIPLNNTYAQFPSEIDEVGSNKLTTQQLAKANNLSPYKSSERYNETIHYVAHEDFEYTGKYTKLNDSGSIDPSDNYINGKLALQGKTGTYNISTMTSNGKTIAKNTTVIAATKGTSSQYDDYLNKYLLVKRAIFNENLKSYVTNIAYFFSERGVLPPSTSVVNSYYYDHNFNGIYDAGDVKIGAEYAIDYENELKNLEDTNMLVSDTSVIDIRDMIAVYLANNATYVPKDGTGKITKMDVNYYIASNPTTTYHFPNNIPVYEKGKFITAYDLSKDQYIIDGRNNVMQNFIKAYNESYDLAYYNSDKDYSGLNIVDLRRPRDINNKYSMHIGSAWANGKSFATAVNNKNEFLDLELFAMSINHVRTVIAFRDTTEDYVDFNNVADIASMGRGLINAPVTNLLYTGGIANQLGKDFVEYVGYYNTPYMDGSVLSFFNSLGTISVKPKLGNGLYLKDIVDETAREDLIKAIKTGIQEIDDRTDARSFNSEAWFAYLSINNGKLITNADNFKGNWYEEADMTDTEEGYFYRTTTKTSSGSDITRLMTTQKFKDDLASGKLKAMEDAFLDHIVITEFPTMYTWGQGMAVRKIFFSGAWHTYYIDVPLAPISMTRDISVNVVSTSPNTDGTMQSVVRVKFDTMPYLPQGMTSDNIIFEALGKDIIVKSITSTTAEDRGSMDTVTYEASDTVYVKFIEFSQSGYTRDGKTLYDRVWDEEAGRAYYTKDVIVNWVTKPTATKDSKIVFTANLLSTEGLNKIVTQDTAKQKADRIAINKALTSDLSCINAEVFKYTGKNLKYSELIQEATISNNYDFADIAAATVDLGVFGYAYDYDEGTKKTTIDIAGFLTGRELVGAELPVEVTLSWETWDGQIGTLTKTSSTLKAGKAESFIFNPNIVPDASGVAPGGTFKVEINPRNVPAELDRTNNVYEGVEFGPKPINGIDFEIYAPFVSFPIVNDGSSATTQFKAYVTLNNTTETKNTVVSLYKMDGAKLIADKNVTVVGGNSLIVDFTVPLNQLAEGSNNLRLVVREL